MLNCTRFSNAITKMFLKNNTQTQYLLINDKGCDLYDKITPFAANLP